MKHPWKKIACFAVGAAMLAALFAVSGIERREADLQPERVTFSVPSGFYDEPFTLELDGNGREVYYTLDSSTPDENSIRYTGSLRIEDASSNKNVYSMIPEVSLDLVPEYLTDNGQEPHYHFKLPNEPVDKATVVRAVCIDEAGNLSEVANAVYFVGYGGKTGYGGVKVMAITTDPKNLFDYDTGIYVLGKAFGDILEDGKIVVPQSDKYQFWAANYRNKGSDWEREAYICCFDEDGSPIISGNYGIRLQGMSSRAWLPKGLNIFGRKKYDSPLFDGNLLFGVPYQLDHLALASGSTDLYTLLKDYIVNVIAADMSVSAREYEPCAVFLDGEYWGLYWLTPRHKDDYLSQRYDVQASNIIEVKDGRLEIGKEGDLDLYKDMLSFVADNDMSLPENYARVCELVDIESCIDYYALEIYIANDDWPHVNRALWRTRVAALDRYSDCQWRWLLYDVNFAMFENFTEKDMIAQAVNKDPMFASLVENPEFYSALCARMVVLASETFETSRVEAFISEYKAFMAAPMEKDYNRFYGGEKTIDSFYKRCDAVADFFKARNEYIIEQYGEMAP